MKRIRRAIARFIYPDDHRDLVRIKDQVSRIRYAAVEADGVYQASKNMARRRDARTKLMSAIFPGWHPDILLPEMITVSTIAASSISVGEAKV